MKFYKEAKNEGNLQLDFKKANQWQKNNNAYCRLSYCKILDNGIDILVGDSLGWLY